MSDISKLPKWAQAKFEELQNERDLLAAFHRTQPVEPSHGIQFFLTGERT